jgi:hypothetical protein
MRTTRANKWRLLSILMSVFIVVGVYWAITSKKEAKHEWGRGGGTIYDSDPGTNENFVNENVLASFSLVSGYIEDIGNPENGLAIIVSHQKRGWGPFTADVRGQTDYTTYPASEWRFGSTVYQIYLVEKSGYWNVSPGAHVFWSLSVQVTQTGRLETDFGVLLRLWTDVDNNVTNGYGSDHKPDNITIWDKEDDLTLTVELQGESLTGEMRLFGLNWIV